MTTLEVTATASDLSGIDTASVKIGGALATRIDDSTWARRVDLAPTGMEAPVTLEAKKTRGISISDFVWVTRRRDTINPTCGRLANPVGDIVPFDTTSIEVVWSVSDNDRVADGWIQDVQVSATSEGYTRQVPLAQGVQWIRFKAQDPMGNSVQDSFRIERLPMDTAPGVSVSDTNSLLRSGHFYVTLATSSSGPTIRYTMDGTDPTEQSPEYGKEPGSKAANGVIRIRIDTTLTLKARAFATNRVPGRILTQNYQLALPAAVSGGLGHSLFLLSDGSLWGVGSNARNAFSPGDKHDYSLPIKIADSVVEMSAGRDFSIWRKRDGSLWGIGANDSGNLGVGTNVDVAVPTLIATNVKSAQAILEQHILVLKEDGSLWGAGANCYGQLGTGDLISPNTLKPIATDVVRFGGGSVHSFFVKSDESLWSMGSPFFGKLGFDTTMWVSSPRKVMDSIADVVGTSTNTTFAITTSGKLVGFGWNHEGELGNGDTAFVITPTQLPLFESEGKITKIVSHNHTFALSENGTLLASGWNSFSNIRGDLPESNPTPLILMRGVQTMGIGLAQSFAITKTGCLFGWGANNYGQLGVNSIGWNIGVSRVRF